MTRTIDSNGRETDVYVDAKTVFYDTKIPVGHPQLRHLISCPSSNSVYYVNGRDVYWLDPRKQIRYHLAVLPFETRCTASGHGWFCAGGEKEGRFAAIRIPDPGKDSLRSTMQIDLVEQQLWIPRRIYSARLGENIVNSISVYRLPSWNGKPGEPVAIVTNNDMTVRIYSLEQERELCEERIDFETNHATLSPDGTTMICVGDREIAYFYRLETGPPSQGWRLPTGVPALGGNQDVAAYSSVNLRLLKKVNLHKPTQAESSAYFTTAWSSTGRLCATASEQGYITVLNVQSLETEDEDPTLVVIPSSRPLTVPGAVRSMCFAPEPWDLLIWAENHGRICVADLRNALASRQTITLDTKSEHTTQPSLTDVDAYADLDNFDFDAFLSDPVGTFALPQALNEEPQPPTDQSPRLFGDELHGLTEHERQILTGLRMTRQQEARLQTGNSISNSLRDRRPSPRSINYPPSGRREGEASSSSRETDQARQQALQAAILAHDRDYLRSQARTAQSSRQQPRRRSSVVLSPTSTSEPRQTETSTPGTGSSRFDDLDSLLDDLTPESLNTLFLQAEHQIRSDSPATSTRSTLHSSEQPALTARERLRSMYSRLQDQTTGSNPGQSQSHAETRLETFRPYLSRPENGDRTGSIDSQMPTYTNNPIQLAPAPSSRAPYLVGPAAPSSSTSADPSVRIRVDALTTRGEAMLARQRARETDRQDRESLERMLRGGAAQRDEQLALIREQQSHLRDEQMVRYREHQSRLRELEHRVREQEALARRQDLESRIRGMERARERLFRTAERDQREQRQLAAEMPASAAPSSGASAAAEAESRTQNSYYDAMLLRQMGRRGGQENMPGAGSGAGPAPASRAVPSSMAAAAAAIATDTAHDTRITAREFLLSEAAGLGNVGVGRGPPGTVPSMTSLMPIWRSADPEWGPGTAGLAMDNRGRTLYVGTEDGIFELHMNFASRMIFPAFDPR